MPPCGWLLARRVPTRGDGLTDALALLRRKCHVGADRHFPASVSSVRRLQVDPEARDLVPEHGQDCRNGFYMARHFQVVETGH